MSEDSLRLSAKEAVPSPDRGRLNWHAPKFIVEKVDHVTATKPNSSGGDNNPTSSHVS